MRYAISDFIAQRTAEFARCTVRRGGSPHGITGRSRHLFHGMGDGDDCSRTAVPILCTLVRETYSDGTLFSLGELRVRGMPILSKSDTRVAVHRRIYNERAMSNCPGGYRGRRSQSMREVINHHASVEAVHVARVVYGTKAPRERFGRNFAHAFEAPLTVWVGKLFIPWVQGSLSKAGGIPPVVTRRVSF